MRVIILLSLATVISACSLFGSYAWLHPEKTETMQLADKSECLALASIVYGSNEDLLNLATFGTAKPNRGVEADCLAEKGYRRVFTRTQT